MKNNYIDETNIYFVFRIPEVTWQGQNIVVYDHVIISPPYKPENVKGTGNPEDKAILYIKNIVSKHSMKYFNIIFLLKFP